MSEREKHENPGKPSAPDHSKQYMAPRRFVFNVPDVQHEEKSTKPNHLWRIGKRSDANKFAASSQLYLGFIGNNVYNCWFCGPTSRKKKCFSFLF